MTTTAELFPSGAPDIGESDATATVASSGSADLVTALTNANGVRITGVSMRATAIGNGMAGLMEFVVGGATKLSVYAQSDTASSGIGNAAIGGLCNIIVPAGQAIGYTFTETTAATARIDLTYEVL